MTGGWCTERDEWAPQQVIRERCYHPPDQYARFSSLLSLVLCFSSLIYLYWHVVHVSDLLKQKWTPRLCLKSGRDVPHVKQRFPKESPSTLSNATCNSSVHQTRSEAFFVCFFFGPVRSVKSGMSLKQYPEPSDLSWSWAQGRLQTVWTPRYKCAPHGDGGASNCCFSL